MAPTVISVSVTIPHLSGIPKDRDVNVFHFLSNGDDVEADGADCFAALENFYMGGRPNPAVPTDFPLARWMSPALSESADVVMKAYATTDLTGETPTGPPFATDTFTLDLPPEEYVHGSVGATDALPNEVSIVLTFHGDLTGIPENAAGPPPTRPRARRRGRIYFGPLNTECLDWDGSTGETFASAAILNALASGGAELAVRMDGAGTARWVVWSKTAGETYGVVGGWADNAFDTQRRRGQEATVRTPWSIL